MNSDRQWKNGDWFFLTRQYAVLNNGTYRRIANLRRIDYLTEQKKDCIWAVTAYYPHSTLGKSSRTITQHSIHSRYDLYGIEYIPPEDIEFTLITLALTE